MHAGKKCKAEAITINSNTFTMSPKTIKALAVIFVGLLLIIFEINWLDKSASEKKSVKADFNLEKIDAEKVGKIIISKGAEKKELVRAEQGWTIGGKKVSDAEIDGFFSELRRAKILEIASKNKNNQEGFGLGDGQAYLLEIVSSGKDGQKILVGKAGSKGNSFYAKKEGSNNVYLVYGSLLSKITQTEDTWLEKEEKSEDEAAENDASEKK